MDNSIFNKMAEESIQMAGMFAAAVIATKAAEVIVEGIEAGCSELASKHRFNKAIRKGAMDYYRERISYELSNKFKKH